MRFSIRELMLLVVIIALAIVWLKDRAQLRRDATLEIQRDVLREMWTKQQKQLSTLRESQHRDSRDVEAYRLEMASLRKKSSDNGEHSNGDNHSPNP